MARLVRWDPLRDSVSLRRMMDRLYDESFVGRPEMARFTWKGDGMVPVDMWETAGKLVIDVTAPGFDREEIEVSIEGYDLTVRGKHDSEAADEGKKYIFRERRNGSFWRSISLPTDVLTDKATAEYINGILTLSFPKVEESKPRRIEVKAK